MGTRIVVIDDSEDYAAFIVERLCRSGYEAFALPCGHYVTARLSEAHADAPVDLVITDLVMPEFDGIELLSFITAAMPGIPVIGISGHGEVLLRALAALGARHVFRKPVEEPLLLAAIRSILGNPLRTTVR
jgi:DNA-binding NtrC family response regulator